MLVVSFATEGNIYENYVKRLAESCVQHGIPHDIEIIPPTPAPDVYLRKPRFILEMMAKHQQPLLYLDADAVVSAPFSLPEDGQWDIGFVPNNLAGLRRSRIAAFAVAMAPTPEAATLIETWAYICDWRKSKSNDHGRLMMAVRLQGGTFREIDLTPWLRGAITRDFGRDKQYTVQGPMGLAWHKTIGTMHRIRRGLGLSAS